MHGHKVPQLYSRCLLQKTLKWVQTEMDRARISLVVVALSDRFLSICGGIDYGFIGNLEAQVWKANAAKRDYAD